MYNLELLFKEETTTTSGVKPDNRKECRRQTGKNAGDKVRKVMEGKTTH